MQLMNQHRVVVTFTLLFFLALTAPVHALAWGRLKEQVATGYNQTRALLTSPPEDRRVLGSGQELLVALAEVKENRLDTVGADRIRQTILPFFSGLLGPESRGALASALQARGQTLGSTPCLAHARALYELVEGARHAVQDVHIDWHLLQQDDLTHVINALRRRSMETNVRTSMQDLSAKCTGKSTAGKEEYGDHLDDGLSLLGERLTREMNQTGFMMDLLMALRRWRQQQPTTTSNAWIGWLLSEMEGSYPLANELQLILDRGLERDPVEGGTLQGEEGQVPIDEEFIFQRSHSETPNTDGPVRRGRKIPVEL